MCLENHLHTQTFIQRWPCAGLGANPSSYFVPLSPVSSQGLGRCLCCPHVTEEETEAQRRAKSGWGLRSQHSPHPDQCLRRSGVASLPAPRPSGIPALPSRWHQFHWDPAGARPGWGGAATVQGMGSGNPPAAPPSLTLIGQSRRFIEVLKCLECHPAPASGTAVCLLCPAQDCRASCCICVLQV